MTLLEDRRYAEVGFVSVRRVAENLVTGQRRRRDILAQTCAAGWRELRRDAAGVKFLECLEMLENDRQFLAVASTSESVTPRRASQAM
jgi:hypothetical protein